MRARLDGVPSSELSSSKERLFAGVRSTCEKLNFNCDLPGVGVVEVAPCHVQLCKNDSAYSEKMEN